MDTIPATGDQEFVYTNLRVAGADRVTFYGKGSNSAVTAVILLQTPTFTFDRYQFVVQKNGNNYIRINGDTSISCAVSFSNLLKL